MPASKMIHRTDPAEDIFNKIGMRRGILPGFELFGNRVLIGIYERPLQTEGGILLPDQVRFEDIHQGKAGVILALGPTAFMSDDNYDFKGLRADVGEWVAIFVSDGRKIVINKQLCRVVEDYHITLKIPAPDSVF